MSNEINSAVNTLRTAFGKVNFSDSGVGVAEGGKDIALTTLPEGVTKETLKAMQEHRDHLIAAGTLALSESGFDFLKKNPGVPEVSMRINYGTDVGTIRIKREKLVRNVQTGETSTVHGAVGVAFKVSARPNRGELKKVCAGIKESFKGLAD